MLTKLLLPWLPGLRLDTITIIADTITLVLTTVGAEAICPLCGQASGQIHSRYMRTVADVPWAGVAVQLHLHARTFCCRNPACSRVVFTERVPQLVAPSARRTQRLQAEQRQLALEQGGEAGARTAYRQGMPVSARSLLRFVRQTPLAESPTPRVLGVDDFAFRKGQTYGTLLVDLERHQPVDLLPDRSADTLARWLAQHPGVAIISRDRGIEYSDGATRGAPDAVQVADRFHLLHNLREMLQRLLERHQSSLRTAMQEAAATHGIAASIPLAAPRSSDDMAPVAQRPVPADGAQPLHDPTTAHGLSQIDQWRQLRRAQRLARYQEVRQLRTHGLSLREIARQLQLGRQTVRRVAMADHFPERATRRKVPSKLDPYVPYLQHQLAAGRDNGMQLWREIRDPHGYTGSRALVARWVAQHRLLSPATPPGQQPLKRRGRPPPAGRGSSPPPVRRLSARQAAWLFVCRPDTLAANDRAIVERLCHICAEVQAAYALAHDFIRMVRDRQAERFDAWVRQANTSGISEVETFVAGLQRDKAAVSAALSLPYNNGQVEGQITKLKLIKRSAYGRASFELLRQRVLAA